MRTVKAIFGILFFGFTVSAAAQSKLLSREVNPLKNAEFSGPGSTVHKYLFFNFGLKPDVIGTNVSRLKASSNSFTFGRRVKHRFNDQWSFVNELHLRRVSVRPKPAFFMKQLADDEELESQQIAQHFFGLALSGRYNFHPVGNAHGNYLEFGVWGDILIWSKYAWKPEGSDDRKRRYPVNSLSNVNGDVNLVAAGAHARLGFEWFAFFTEYRFTPYFKTDKESTEGGNQYYNAAPLTVGVEFILLSLE